MSWTTHNLSACQKRRLNFGANISVSRRAAAATADQSKRNDTTFVLRSKQKVVKNLHHTKCWILLSLKKHLTLYFVFQILWPNKKRRILCTTFTKRQNPNGQIYSTEDSKIGVDCQNQRYLATYLHGTYNSFVKGWYSTVNSCTLSDLMYFSIVFLVKTTCLLLGTYISYRFNFLKFEVFASFQAH